MRLTCRCEKDTKTTVKKSSSLNKQPTQLTPSQLQDQQKQGWRVFDWQAYQVPWDVPWDGKTTAATMAVWTLSFAGTAFLLMPLAYTRIVGMPLYELSPAGQADFALWSEIVELVVTFAVIGSVVARYKPAKQQQLFNFSLGQPFQTGSGWLAWGLLGAAAAPIVVGSMALLLTAVGYESATAGGHGTVDGVAGMISMDTPTYVRLLMVTGVLAPFLEETLFRGFLLTSLTKVMPPWAAVIASAGAFAIAHLSLKDLPVLFALGCWLGAIYCRSRNLLTPMIVHGAWNSTVLTLLFWLTANGVDIQQLLKEGNL